jgi:hypothetical protein
MSTIRVNSIQHSGAANASIELSSNGRVTFSNTVAFTSNVGIGTTSPDTKLVIEGGTSEDQFRLGTGTNYYRIGRESISTGSLTFYGTQSGATGYVFSGINGERMRIDSAGRITMPFQPAFAAWGGTTQSWSGTANYQVLQLNTTGTSNNSRNSGYSTSTYRYTAPVSGMYMFFGKITQTTAVTGPALILTVNGSTVMTEMAIGYSVAYMSTSGMWPVYMNAGDFADLRVANFNNVNLTLDLGRCNFVGWLLG